MNQQYFSLLSRSKKFRHRIKLFLLGTLTIFWVWACSSNVSQNTQRNTNYNSRSPVTNCHIIKHAMGETCVPVQPQRVVVLNLLDNALALGIKPVGATTAEENSKVDSLLPAQITSIVPIGWRGQPNLESIINLQPDLILGLDWQDAIYSQLSQIAPTVIVGSGSDLNWQEWFKTYAEALGKTEEAKQLLSEYHKRIALFRKQMGDRLLKTQVSLVNFWADYVRIYLKQSFSGQILDDIGLPRPPAQDRENSGNSVSENLSLELIPQMDGDVIFLMLGGQNQSKLVQFTSHPLWSQLTAVKQKKVYEVDSETWISSWSIVGANCVLDDLFKFLVEERK